MFCKYCGSAIDGDSVFCEACGRKIKDESMVNIPPAPRSDRKTQDTYNTPVAKEALPKSKRAKKRKKANKAIICLVFAMLIASVGKFLIYILATFGILALNQYVLRDISGFNLWHESIILSVVEFGVVLFSIVVILLFSLCCKGATKKLQFISSAFAGTIVWIGTNRLVMPIMESILEMLRAFDGWLMWLVFICLILLIIAAMLMLLALSIVVAVSFFKSFNKFKPVSLVEGEKRFSVKAFVISVAAIFSAAAVYPVFDAILSEIYKNITIEYLASQWLNYGWYLAGQLLALGILLSTLFIIRDRYKAISCIAAACLGYNFLGMKVANMVYNVAGLILMDTEHTINLWLFSVILGSIIIAVCGVVFYILLNLRKMEKIKKKAE